MQKNTHCSLLYGLRTVLLIAQYSSLIADSWFARWPVYQFAWFAQFTQFLMVSHSSNHWLFVDRLAVRRWMFTLLACLPVSQFALFTPSTLLAWSVGFISD
jgi:hypothetical protein